MSPQDRDLKPLAYELPVTVKMTMENWLARLQAIAIITVLFAGVQSQLIASLPNDDHRGFDVALRFFAYGGLFLNLGDTLSAVLLLVAITSLPLSARYLYVSCQHSFPRQMFRLDGSDPAREAGDLQDILLKRDSDTQLLRAFGIARGWATIMNHCILSFILGCVFTFIQVALTVWIAERVLAAALFLPLALFGVLPPLCVFFGFMGPPECSQCVDEVRVAPATAPLSWI
ncbi:hypothetical protein AURDEDRAFT_156342 [Auricularia subglabra TFB-10046 SS5]|nr:hypothetical protein AURDEDRAFT_156342 [Auricularia subglabra TFB-10046 SS5]